MVQPTQDIMDNESDLVPAFKYCRFLVLDEADRLLEPSFEEDLRTILQILPAQRQTLLFSATMTMPLQALQQVGAA